MEVGVGEVGLGGVRRVEEGCDRSRGKEIERGGGGEGGSSYLYLDGVLVSLPDSGVVVGHPVRIYRWKG